MVSSIATKRISKFVLSMLTAIAIILSMGIVANAEKYKNIQIDVPRISQRPNTGDCAIASMATIEAYCHGLPSGDYTSAAYQAVYSANGYSIGASWSKLGYDADHSFSMQLLYDQLKTGYPVIVHRTSSHYSVVYGYDGSTSNLEMSGFLVVDVDDSYNSTTAYKRLDRWKGSTSLDRIVVRLNGLAIPASTLKINGNHPAENTVTGSSFDPYGMVISNKTITNVTVTVSTSSGKVVQSYSATPNSTSFSVSTAKSKIKISELATGSYIYTVYAKDSSGTTKAMKFGFAVGAAVPPDVNEDDNSSPIPTITEVSYKVIIKPEKGLNLRMSADVQSTKITTIPRGTVVPITAECNGWGLATYQGHAGWILLSYTEKYIDQEDTPPAPPIVDPAIPVIDSVKYARVTASTSIKSTAFIFSSNVISVAKNDIVRVISTDGNWLKVSFKGKEGYISSSLCVNGLFDVDADGIINSSDALAVLEASIGKKVLTNVETQVADADGNGKVNSADALLILRVATGEKTY